MFVAHFKCAVSKEDEEYSNRIMHILLKLVAESQMHWTNACTLIYCTLYTNVVWTVCNGWMHTFSSFFIHKLEYWGSLYW